MNCLRRCCCPQNNEAVELYPAEGKKVQMAAHVAQLAKEQFSSQLFEERGPQAVTMDAPFQQAKAAQLVDLEIVDPEKAANAAEALRINRAATEMAESLTALDMTDAISSVTPDVEHVSPNLKLRAPTPPVHAAAASSGIFQFNVEPPTECPSSPSLKERVDRFLETADASQTLHIDRNQLGMADSLAQLDMTDSILFVDSDAEHISPEHKRQPSPQPAQGLGAASSSVNRQERIGASLPAAGSSESIVMIDADGAETEEHI